MRTIFILMDSLNRHYLNAYQESWIQTPNLDRLAARSTVFCNHWAGSLPCMPARRDLMTGRYNFLETPWSPLQPWDDCLPVELRNQCDTYSHMITDHYHYFHSGGEAYHTRYNSWEFERGQEGDVWRPMVRMPEVASGRGKSIFRGAYWKNRACMDPESDLHYPTPRCFERAIEFVEMNQADDNWHLHLEIFDPHEPFDCPKKYVDMYNDVWDRPFFTWPDYAKLDPEHDDELTVQHIRKCYAGVLTMADAWLGKLLDKLDELDMWKDTQVILTTDHGHLLGEHGFWAKNYMFDYAELARIPLFIASPGQTERREVSSLTSVVDLMPTLMEQFGATLPGPVHGKSLAHLLKDDEPHHDAVMYGYFGKDVNITDGCYTYCRQPEAGALIHHHTAMPCSFTDFYSREKLAEAETGVFLNNSHNIPHYRFVEQSWRHHSAPEFHPLYDLSADPQQDTPLHDPQQEERMIGILNTMLQRCDAPACQYSRLGL